MADNSSGDSAERRVGGADPDHPSRERKSSLQQSKDRSKWNLLLIPAIVIPLLVPLYNRVEPTLFGWPFFYWGQLACIALGVATTSLVYQKTKTRKDPDVGWASEATERRWS